MKDQRQCPDCYQPIRECECEPWPEMDSGGPPLGAMVFVSPLFASSPQNTPQLATGDEYED